ncbi:MAG: hypothetical protein DWQ04_08565, partial [Chloroflexi bacterium]
MNGSQLIMRDRHYIPTPKKQRLLDWFAEVQDVSWRWVVPAGVLVTIANVVFVGMLISFYAVY